MRTELEEIADYLSIPDGEDDVNLGSAEEFFEGFGVEYDEYTLDEINRYLRHRGVELIDCFGQLILSL